MGKFVAFLTSLIFVSAIWACPMDGKAKEKGKGKNPSTVQTG